jgi:putative nucleotidyltransferase with HDIG domain
VLDAIAPSRRTARPSPRTIDTAELIVQLLETALVAPDVSSAVSPMLSALLARTAAVGSAYFQARGQSFIARAASGVMPQGPAMDAILLHGLPAETPLLQALRHSDRALFFADTHAVRETTGFPALGVQSLAAAPVHTRDGQFLGAFLMHTFVHHAWTRAEQQLFTAVSRMVAQLTARLVAEEQACQAQEDAIRALGLALEYRDDDTKGHTDRVTRLALRLGQALQLGDEELTALRWGAYLHDVGKMAIPDSILRKPARLDPDERTQMQQHAAIGATFAHQLSFMPPAAQALVRSHHERWDGTGYPDGLRGVEIPLTARIFALCDVYDALTSDRPYKRAWSPADALREIQNGAGSHFDPDLVARFVEIAAEIAEGE